MAIDFCLSTGNLETAEHMLSELGDLGSRFLEPDMGYLVDLLGFRAMYKRKKHYELKNLLVDKLKHLLELGYCKRSYFELLALLLDVYVELNDFTQVSNLVDNNLQTAVQYNLETYYYLLKVYELRVYTETGNLDKAESIYKDTKLGVNKMERKVQALFYYNVALLFIKLYTKDGRDGYKPAQGIGKDMQNNLRAASDCALEILDLELLNKVAFSFAVVSDIANEPANAELWAKKHLQVEHVCSFVEKNYKPSDLDRAGISGTMSFFGRVYSALKDVINK